MRRSQTLTEIATAVLQGMDGVLETARPELVLVHGDTSTTLYGAISAFYRQIPIGHVEAGLRSGDRYSPWPEEANRLLTDRISDLLFAPTPRARTALAAEGIAKGVVVTGNTGIDAVQQVAKRSH
ncbi:UDP-N-acetylglucosamine 2-epimerase, partial [mine drainage metagenome]